MSKKREPTPQPEPQPPLSSIELELMETHERLKNMENFLIETRETAVIQSQSLPFLMYQFKRSVADIYATKQSLVEVEKEVSIRHTSFESAVRDRARESEKARRLGKYLDTALLHYRTIADENISLKEQINKLELELEAKQKVIQATSGLLESVSTLIEEKKHPPDVIAELRRLLQEVPKPLPPSQPAPPLEAGEEEMP